MTVLLVRLAFSGIRSRLLASALTIAIAAATVATIVLALEVRSTGVDPWQRTFARASGAHVLAFVPSQADAAAIGRLPGVTERSAPVPLVWATVGPRGSSDQVQLAGLSGRTAVNMPVLTAGSQLREGGIMLERSLARALAIEVGATLGLTSRRGSIEIPVLGTAVVPSQPRYPRRRPGLAWVTRATLDRIEPDRARWSWSEAVRLADPSAAAAFTERAAAGLPATASRSGPLYFETWQNQRDNALGDAQGTQVIVTIFTVLLLIVAFVVVGILVGARASEQHRQIGLLKAAGFTPRQVGIVFALESAALGLVAAALGFVLGAMLAPRLAAPSAETLLGSPTMAAISLAHPRGRLCRGSRARGRSFDLHAPQHSLYRARGDPCGQPVSRQFTAGACRRPIRHAVHDRARAQRPPGSRAPGASPRGRDRAHRRDGCRRAIARRDARRAACFQDQ